MCNSAKSLTQLARSPLSGISVCVVGAGPAGVYTALQCWRKGHNVRILERNPVARTQGDFFMIAPQVVNHIKTWPDMADENDRIAADPRVSFHRNTGERISGPSPFSFDKGKGNNDADELDPTRRFHFHHRPKFLQMLISQLERIGVQIEYGCRAAEFYEGADKAGVRLGDGRTIEADVIVAADGIGTKSHTLVNGQDIRAWPSGLAGFRAAFPADVIADDAEVSEQTKILDDGHPHFQLFHGLGLHMTLMRTEDIITWGMTHKDEGTASESWFANVDPSTVMDHVSTIPTFPSFLKRLIELTPKDGIVDWKIMWRNPQPLTTSPLGRVVQVGDAAHTLLPSSMNGANQALEDAIYLAACLELGGKENVPWATKVHNKLRFERVSCCQKLGFVNLAKRNNRDAKTADRKKTEDLVPEQGRWLWGHDPEKYVQENFPEALDHLQKGTPLRNTNIPPGYVHEEWSVDELRARVERNEPLNLGGDWS
ncbi:uncharacterized protein PG986_013082 [Apiospora aurea]|uniref:FAD-binding domain-containing protein n=1 Tax=Apiospora aurea TaxID=335848 RepID=A0ABR1Q1V8_9PEZI